MKWITFFLLLLKTLIPSHPHNIRFETVNRGLSDYTVNCIFQDSRGFLWVGTDRGINRYDGIEFSRFTPDSQKPGSISGMIITSIAEDKQGMIWFGTDKGLNRFNPLTEKFKHFQHDPANKNSISFNDIRAIIVDRKGIIWIATYGGGLNRYDHRSKSFTSFRHQPGQEDTLNHNALTSLREDRSGLIWIGTVQGLNCLYPQTRRLKCYYSAPGTPGALLGRVVHSIFQDRLGAIWVGTNEGLNRYQPDRDSFIHFVHEPGNKHSISPGRVMSICEDFSENLWIATSRGGLNRFDRGTQAFLHYSSNPDDPVNLQSNFLKSLYTDRTAVLWIGTFDCGLIKAGTQKQFDFYNYRAGDEKGLSSPIVTTVYQSDKNTLWVGTFGGGLNRLKPKTGECTHYKSGAPQKRSNQNNQDTGLYHNVIFSIKPSRSKPDTLWLATVLGLNRFHIREGTFDGFKLDPNIPESEVHNGIYTICEDREGMLWLGTHNQGLVKFNPRKKKFIFHRHDPSNSGSISNNTVIAVTEDHSGDIWAGTWGGGLNVWKRRDHRFLRFQSRPNNPGSISSNYLSVVYEDGKDTLWIGTVGGGLNKYNPDNSTFVHYGKGQGLADDFIMGITEAENGSLWISTANGLFCFNPETETFRNYLKDDDYGNGKFFLGACYKNEDGIMLFGHSKGICFFRPENIQQNKCIPPIALTSCTVYTADGETKIPTGGLSKVEMNHDQSLSLSFAALCFQNPGNNQYAYMFENQAGQWKYLGNQNELFFARISPGKYTLRIKGSNNDGIWNEDGILLEIAVQPPFWQTWWFRVAILISAVFTALFWYRSRTRKITQRLRTQLQMEKLCAKHKITRREKEIIELIIKGKSNKDIEDLLFISIGTIKNHVYNIYRKLKVKNRAQLVNLFKNVILDQAVPHKINYL